MKKSILATLLALGLSASMTLSARSILDIKQSITDDNIIAPESFETQTRLLEENFYIKNYVVPGMDLGEPQPASPAEYEERLKVLPTVIEMPYNSLVGNFINMYLTKKRTLVADMLALHSYYGPIFVEELIKEGMPTELQYLPVIESAINPNAISRAGAAGLWQFMPATAKGLGMEVNSLVDERRVVAGNHVLEELRVEHADFIDRDVEHSRNLVEVYVFVDSDSVGGEMALDNGRGYAMFAIIVHHIVGGDKHGDIASGLCRKKLIDFPEILLPLPCPAHGFVDIAGSAVVGGDRKRPVIVDVVELLQVAGGVARGKTCVPALVPVDEIRMLNPQFLKDVIPGDYRPYTLTLPTQQCLSYVMSEKRIADYDSELYARRSHVEPGAQPADPVLPESDHGAANLASASRQSVNAETNNELAHTGLVEQMTVRTHVVGRGESIRDIARKYGVSATDIKRWNHLRRGKVREGDSLRIETFERMNPENIKVVAAAEVAQVTPQELREAGATELVVAVAKASGLSSASTPSTSGQDAAASPASAEPATPAKTPAKTTAAPKKAAPATTVYRVRKGDNLGKIAARYGTTVAAIQAANGMGSKTALQIGQKLKIPPKKAKKSTSRRRRR